MTTATFIDDAERTRVFLTLVDCDPADVKDIPADRIGVAPTYVSPERAAAARGTVSLPFGKHKGKTLDESPLGYLEWLAKQPPMDEVKSSTRRGIEKTKQKIRNYLDHK